MATFLDVGLVQYFQAIYPVLFVFTLVFALLQKTGAIGKNVALNAVIAVAVSFMMLLSKNAVALINFMIPWFIVAAIFFVLLLLIYQIFGADEKLLTETLKKDKAIVYVIIGIALVIMIAGFANVFGQSLLGGAEQATQATTEGGVATENFQQNIYATLFHPKVLGLIILFAIAIAAVALLSSG